jgi:hypothetical protein
VKSARLATLTHLANATPRARDFHAYESVDAAFAAIRAAHGVDLRDTRVVSSAAPDAGERAASAFRAAARIIEGRRPRKE